MQQENKTNKGTELLDILFCSFTWVHTTTCMGSMFYSFMPPRNIFTYLNVTLIITICMMVNEQSMSFILKLFFDSLPFIYAFISRTLITTATLLYFGIILNLSFFRILLIFKVNFLFLITIITLIFKPAAFHNLKHEKTFRIIFGSLLLMILALLSPESLYRFKYIKGKSKRN